MALSGSKMRGWWKSRKSAPFSSASSKTSGSGVSATRTRFTSASGSPTCKPQLSHSSASDNGAILSTASAICATRTKIQALYNPRTVKRLRLAELVSAATRLPVIAVPLFLAVGVEAAGIGGLLWAVLCIFLTSGLSLLYLLYLTRSGKVRDPRAIPRVERVGPLRVVAALHAAAFVIVTLLGGPAELRAALLSYALATLAFVLITPLSNLSLHAAGVSGTAICLAYVFGAWGLPAFALLPPVFWARLELGRHTLAELALGAIVGGGGTWISFHLIG
jgi:hypothetical protein